VTFVHYTPPITQEQFAAVQDENLHLKGLLEDSKTGAEKKKQAYMAEAEQNK